MKTASIVKPKMRHHRCRWLLVGTLATASNAVGTAIGTSMEVLKILPAELKEYCSIHEKNAGHLFSVASWHHPTNRQQRQEKRLRFILPFFGVVVDANDRSKQSQSLNPSQ